MLLCVSPCTPVRAQNKAVPETQVMAVFLFNFTQFTEWPRSAFPSADAPLIIGIVGPDPFGRYLDETIENEKVQGHPLIVQRYRDMSDIKNCHVLYISEKDPEKVTAIINLVKNKNTLTISDFDNFSRMGGMIGFYKKDKKIRLQANPGAAKSAGLVISSKLLRVSEINE